MLDLILHVLKNGFFITSLVLVMMMMIEYINVGSSGRLFEQLLSSKPRQVLFGALLGVLPGCLGGFAAVSLYSHGMFSIGALVAAMVSSSGDESFVMLAMIPKTALILFAILFVIAIICGLVTDQIFRNKKCDKFLLGPKVCDVQFKVHHEHSGEIPNIFHISSYKVMKHPSWQRITVLLGVLIFAVAIFTGFFDHGHAEDNVALKKGLTLFDEKWVIILFACLSIILLFFIAASSEHFVKEHIWNHVIKKHALSIFLWTTGALAVISIGLHYFDLEAWFTKNSYIPYLMLIFAALVGMIPESGPNMIFITLFASGLVPFSVLLTSSISQDGHTSLPLLASSKRSFLIAKVINAVFAIIFGSIFFLFGV